MTIAQIRDEMLDLLGPDGVITAGPQLRTYECDGLTGYRVRPALVVLPTTTEHVAAVIRACRRTGVPFVARGSGTGLSGGALPHADGVLVVLARMRSILHVDVENRYLVAEPGVTNAKISAAVADHGLYYAPDPSSQIVCSIGGNVAENSGGVHCLKYGFTTNHVQGLEFVTTDGEVVDLGGPVVDTPGYDLRGVVVGSEGTLGIATKVVVRLLRRPEAVETLLADFDTPREAGDAVTAITTAGIMPAGMEMMDELAIQACEEDARVGLNLQAGAVLVVELDGPRAEVAALFGEVQRHCEDAGATNIRIAEDAAERALIWKGRKAAFAAMGRLSRDYFVQDGVIPRTKLGEVLERIDEMSTETGYRVANVFHAGDGNLHPLVLYDGRNEGEADEAEELAIRIVELCVESGGSITGEHGVGTDKACSMPKMFGEEDLALMQRVRAAFDPDGICNPGKLFPTPRLCGERPGPYRPHALEQAGLAERL
ncbi:MAG TPA: FAD-linked oxidase C-terminal domain-containing protein [Euzebyales bacterium]|nr:FAD-linked oxidase C-terminal domain-containing protein [Euzebyales bacterium]